MKNDTRKQCTVCKLEKDSFEFYKSRSIKGGLSSGCKKCYSDKYSQTNKRIMEVWRTKNREHRKEYWKMYMNKNRSELKKKRDIYIRTVRKVKLKERRRVDGKFRLDCNMASAISAALRGAKAGRKWQDLVGYTAQDLIQHLQSQFNKNMSWGNYGSYWWVDHILPRSYFKYEAAEEPGFKRCWALDNLQPMEKIANIIKGATVVSPR